MRPGTQVYKPPDLCTRSELALDSARSCSGSLVSVALRLVTPTCRFGQTGNGCCRSVSKFTNILIIKLTSLPLWIFAFRELNTGVLWVCRNVLHVKRKLPSDLPSCPVGMGAASIATPPSLTRVLRGGGGPSMLTTSFTRLCPRADHYTLVCRLNRGQVVCCGGPGLHTTAVAHITWNVGFRQIPNFRL